MELIRHFGPSAIEGPSVLSDPSPSCSSSFFTPTAAECFRICVLVRAVYTFARNNFLTMIEHGDQLEIPSAPCRKLYELTRHNSYREKPLQCAQCSNVFLLFITKKATRNRRRVVRGIVKPPTREPRAWSATKERWNSASSCA